MVSLKQKTIKSFFWVSINTLGDRLLQFGLGIILARILLPSDFGVIGLITVFISISTLFIDSGFSFALIRKEKILKVELDTVFWFNLSVSIVVYLFLFILSPLIAKFFDQPLLLKVVRFVAINLIINAFGSIQNINLRRELRFKEIAITGISVRIVSGVIAILLAKHGFGIWSLIFQQLISNLLNNLLLFYFNKHIPRFLFSYKHFKDLFSFSSKLLYSGILYSFISNIYPIIIGKLFSINEVGYFNRALSIQKFPVNTFTTIIQQVTLPIFSKIQNEEEKFRLAYKKAIQLAVFTIALPLALLYVSAIPFITFLLTEKWLPVAPMLKIIVIGGLFYPLSALNVNIIGIKGRSDLVMYLQFSKDFMTILGLGVGVIWGIEGLIISYAINGILAYFINAFFANKVINYPIINQLKDILPIIFIMLCAAISGYFAMTLVEKNLIKILFSFSLGTIVYIFLARIFRLEVLNEVVITIKKNFSNHL